MLWGSDPLEVGNGFFNFLLFSCGIVDLIAGQIQSIPITILLCDVLE